MNFLKSVSQYIGLYSPKISRENIKKWESNQENTKDRVFFTHSLILIPNVIKIVINNKSHTGT